MRFGVVLVHEMRVVGAHQLHSILSGKLHHSLVRLLLERERLPVSPYIGVLHLVSLQLKIIIVAEDTFVPLYRLARSGDVAFKYLRRDFARYARRTDDKVLVITLEVGSVRTRTHVITVHPCARDKLYEVLVSVIVFRENDEMISAHVAHLLHLVLFPASCDIHLAAQDGLERLLTFRLPLFVYTLAIIIEFLYSEHVAMVCYRHALHPVSHSLVYEALDAGLSVENRIISMNVQMYEIFHFQA